MSVKSLVNSIVLRYNTDRKREGDIIIMDDSYRMETDGFRLSTKERYGKVEITDVAIDKIPRIEYRGFTDDVNDALYKLTRLVLLSSQKNNDSNEVAITCSLAAGDPTDGFGIAYGEEHGVDVLSDTTSNHLIMNSTDCVVIILHNHPSTQTLSIEDIRFFLHFATVKVISVVSNQGTVHYLMKTDKYEYETAKGLYNECVEDLNKESSKKDIYLASLSFLSKCSEVGLFYS